MGIGILMCTFLFGRLIWLFVSFWANINTVYRIVIHWLCNLSTNADKVINQKCIKPYQTSHTLSEWVSCPTQHAISETNLSMQSNVQMLSTGADGDNEI